MDLTTTYMGMHLKNPIVPSASPLSEDLNKIRRMEDAGASAVVMYSLFEEQITLESHQLDHYLSYGAEGFAEALSYFPEMETYKVGPDDYLKGQLGFLAQEDGSCGDGEVIVEIHYTTDDDSGTRTRLGQWPETCNGQLTSIQYNLDDLQGESVQFYLVVLADGPSKQDWAIWSSLGVMR